MNLVQLEVVEEKEEVRNREQISTQTVMQIETVTRHHHHNQNKKTKSITSNLHSIQRYSQQRNSASRQSYKIHASLFTRRQEITQDFSHRQRSNYHHHQSKTSPHIFLPQPPSYKISFKYTKPIVDGT